MSARASFSNDSRRMKVPLLNSVLLKDYLLEDLSSCSSNGFRSYPRRQCFTKVRYLIEIDLNKHMKLPPTQKKFLKRKSKSKSSLVLQKGSAAVVNVFKHFRFSGSGKPAQPKSLPQKNLSRKLSKPGFWKRTTDHHHNKRLNSFDEPVKEKKNKVLPPLCKVSTTTAPAEVNTSASKSNSNSSASTDSYFTTTTTTTISVSSTTNSCSKIIVAQNDVEKREKHGVATAIATATSDSAANGNAKKDEESEKKEQFSPISVMDFPCDNDYNHDDDDEVTSPFQHSHLYEEGTKGKLLTKVQRIKRLAKLTPVRLEDRITLSESTTILNVLHEESSNQPQKKAMALLQQLKDTMPSRNDQFESTMTQNVLLGFFIEQIIEGNVSNFVLLQEAKDWINGHVKEPTFECQNDKLTYIRDLEKGKANWSTYDNQVKKQDIVFELECQVFTSLVEEMLGEFYM